MSIAPSIPVAGDGGSKETRKDRERRHAQGYEEYVKQCAAAGVEAVAWMNWQFKENLKDKARDRGEPEEKERPASASVQVKKGRGGRRAKPLITRG